MLRFILRSVLAAVALAVLSGAALLAIAWPKLGSAPSVREQRAFAASANYDAAQARFVNRRQAEMDRESARFLSWDGIYKWLSGGYETSPHLEPAEPLPEQPFDRRVFMQPSATLKTVWFGHSTLLLYLEGRTVLIDPVFGNAGPVQFLVPRYQPPAALPEDLPAVDCIVISHDHYDHLEYSTVRHYAKQQTVFIVPLGVGAHLRRWGVPEQRIVERDWWQSAQFGGLEFIAAPAQHFSGRALKRNSSLWAAWIIRSDRHSVFYSGDSGYDTHFADIGRKFGPFDLAFLEDGQYNQLWELVHMLPHQVIKAHKELRARRLFPVHWGMFTLSTHAWYEPAQKISRLAEAEGIEVVIPKIGQIVNLTGPVPQQKWWEPLIGRLARTVGLAGD